MADLPRQVAGSVAFIALFVMVSEIDCLSIIEHLVKPQDVVTNCSAVRFVCVVDTVAPDIEVWWTFGGEDISKLPNVTVLSNERGEWQFEILCATLAYKGNYICNVQTKNESEIVYRKEALLRIYVPAVITVGQNVTAEVVEEQVNLTCTAHAYPLAVVDWLRGGVAVNTTDSHMQVNNFEVDNATVQSTLYIDAIERQDNGTYTCMARNEFNNASATQVLLVQEPPEVEFFKDSIIVEDPSTVSLQWHVIFNGNMPVQSFHLQKENSLELERVAVDENIPSNITSYILYSLLPGLMYTFYISAENFAGTSSWDSVNVSLPSDVPPKVSWVHVLASTNETLLFGWRRPNHDNGANITHYAVLLRHNGELIENKTMNIQDPGRNNLMVLFVSLEPGELYTFRVQACNALGCGNWSDALNGTTSDGFADPPTNIEVKCENNPLKDSESITVTWDIPKNARGTIQNYNLTILSTAQFRDESGQQVEEKTTKVEIIDVKTNQLEYTMNIQPNTEYTVQMCTINRAKCGPMSNITANSCCMSASNVPSILPHFYMQRMNSSDECRQLKLNLQRVNERNGSVLCYRVIIIRLRKGQDISKLPSEPQKIILSTHENVHKNTGFGAYVAEAFNSDEFVNEVVIGDNQQRFCDSAAPDKKRHVIETSSRMKYADIVHDGRLSPGTNYTGFVEIRVVGPNSTVLTKTSPYFSPVLTGSPSSPAPSESPIKVIFGVICGVVLVIVALAVPLLLIRRKRCRQNVGNDENPGVTALILRTIHRNGHLPRGKAGQVTKTPKLGPVSTEELPAVFIEKHMDSDLLFQSEFETLPENFKDRTTHASDAPENLCKNRYPDIKAFDQTRVRLPMVDDIAGSDYINANFVEGYKGRKTFICGQGPLDRTITDFWRMLWEHRVTVIVMLTGIEEHGQIKCAQYWDDENTKQIEKLFATSVVNKKEYSDYIVRRFQVQYLKDGLTEEREVLHFHFTLWKDFLAPEQPSWLLRFIKRVNEHYCSDRGPLLVHCSAGVGRTGTFVAIDNLLQQLEEEGQIDVFSHVSALRHQRNFLVQSLEQYIFVYRALMEHAQFGDTEMEIRHLRDHYELLKEKVTDKDKTGLSVEFEKLDDVIEDPKTCCVGTMDMNMGKNRYDFIVPYDLNRVILPPSPSRDHSSYINASFIQGYDRSLSFIITQDPLETTVIEFWRMIKEQYISTLVMLSEIGDGQTKCQQYWPEEKSEKEYDYVKVFFENSEDHHHYILREFSVVNTKNNDKHTLSQFQFQEWKGSVGIVPEGTLGLLTLIEDVQQNQEKQAASGPITVHCSGGGDRSSVFVTLSVLMQQLKAEERVDIFQAARYTRSQRHCMLQKSAQYDFLYRCLLDHIACRNLCDMGDTQL